MTFLTRGQTSRVCAAACFCVRLCERNAWVFDLASGHKDQAKNRTVYRKPALRRLPISEMTPRRLHGFPKVIMCDYASQHRRVCRALQLGSDGNLPD